ncbi:energy-coupling factor transporter transmembrane component T family protein [Rouxiella chamberiensis]|uniref:Energy-coupling factor transporter transmembrane protein EcfT n=1 Tax=Rouxiella chamberiensis TaxID=1513468 RepID=A0ABY7HTA2_9GAMM|nr:energy-coupling factor transporter transmembrane protein EcfT [Rouxiella chamberiensis]WAT02644.1 energy-coupling factor transporter transmembrane protein EcfT [Rouxiella chamberiensis]
MTLSDYIPGRSWIHRTPPGLKLILLAVLGTLLFVYPDWRIAGVSLAVIVLLYPLAGIKLKVMLAQIKPMLVILLVLFVVQWLIVNAQSGLLVVLRLSALLLMASLITLTTRSSDMIEALEKRLTWLYFVGINPAKISLALSLALRFIPVLAAITQEVREAQKARGLNHSVIAVAIPVIIRTLKMADSIAAALEARAYDPQSPYRRKHSAKKEN